MFLNCEKVKAFWNNLKNWLSNNCNIIVQLEDKTCIFSSQKPRSIENYILCLAKYYIYKNKFTKNTLSVQNFVALKINLSVQKILQIFIISLPSLWQNGQKYITILPIIST